MKIWNPSKDTASPFQEAEFIQVEVGTDTFDIRVIEGALRVQNTSGRLSITPVMGNIILLHPLEI